MFNPLPGSAWAKIAFLIFTQILSTYFLGFENSWENVFDLTHLIIYSATLQCAILFYLLESIKPTIEASEEDTGKGSRSGILWISIIGISMLLHLTTYLFSYKLGVLCSLVLLTLFLYQLFIKRIPLLGSLVLAALSTFSVFGLLAFDPHLKTNLLLIFGIYYFGIFWIRGLVREIKIREEFVYRDASSYPTLSGTKPIRLVLVVVMFLYILVLTTCVRLILLKYFTQPLSFVYMAYNVLCIGIPLFHLLSKIQSVSVRPDPDYLLKTADYILLMITLSMLFF